VGLGNRPRKSSNIEDWLGSRLWCGQGSALERKEEGGGRPRFLIEGGVRVSLNPNLGGEDRREGGAAYRIRNVKINSRLWGDALAKNEWFGAVIPMGETRRTDLPKGMKTEGAGKGLDFLTLAGTVTFPDVAMQWKLLFRQKRGVWFKAAAVTLKESVALGRRSRWVGSAAFLGVFLLCSGHERSLPRGDL